MKNEAKSIFQIDSSHKKSKEYEVSEDSILNTKIFKLHETLTHKETTSGKENH